MIRVGVNTHGPFVLGMGRDDLQRELKARFHEKVERFAAGALQPDDYVIRGALVCNSRRDYYSSRFSKDALGEVAELLPGAPKMGAHQYGTLPLALTFDAEVKKLDREDLPPKDRWAVQSLYAIPNDDEGQRVVRRIDMGVYREVSLGWRCAGAECSIDGEHIYACPHIPGDIYKKHGICEFEFSGITNVLEDSIVFRGGQKDTATFIPEAAGSQGERAAAIAGAAAGLMRAQSGDVAWSVLGDMKRASAHDLGALPLHLRAAIAQHARAAGFGLMCATPGERENTQAIVVERSRFAEVAQARRWVRDENFRVDRMKEDGSRLVFHQLDEKRMDPDSFELIKLEDGIHAKVGRVAEKAKEDRSATDGTRTLRGMFQKAS